MFTVREVLDRMPGLTLRHLCEKGGMAVGGTVEKRRGLLQVYYGRQVRDLLGDLRRSDLSRLFRRPIEINGNLYKLRNRSTFTKEQLLTLAISVFVEERLPPLLVAGLVGTGDDEIDGGEGDEETEEETEDGDDGDGDEDEGDEENVEIPLELQSLLGGVTRGAWSSPRTVAMLLQALYGEHYVRLRTARFQRLLEDLRSFGVEAALVDDDPPAPLASDAITPGIDAQLRLRLHTPAPAAGVQPPLPQAAKTPPWPVLPAATPFAPPKVVQPPAAVVTVIANPPAAPRPAVVVVPDPPPVPTPASTPTTKTNFYELALLRMEFLTAVPSVARAQDPAWPDAFLDAASRGFDLDARSQRFLRLAANTFVAGNHDPMPRVLRLAKLLRADEWPMLLLDFERLNPDSNEEAVMETIRHASEIASLPHDSIATSAPAVPVPAQSPNAQGATRSSPPVATLAASAPTALRGGKVAASARGTSSEADDMNKRDMGPLKGMFDD